MRMVAILILLALPLHAEDWTVDGKIYKNPVVISHDEKAVTFQTSDGTATLSISVLDKPIRDRILADAVTASDWNLGAHIFHNVVVAKVEADRVYITYAGGAGTLELADLPPDFQKHFNYDPVKARAALDSRAQLQAESDKAAREAAQRAEAQQEQEDKRQEIIKQAVTIRGTVFQILPEGILVRCPTAEELMVANNAAMAGTGREYGGGGTSMYDRPADGGPSLAERLGFLPEKGTHFAEGICFLKNYSGKDQLVDNSQIRVIAYPNGPYSYETTDGSTATISSYTVTPP